MKLADFDIMDDAQDLAQLQQQIDGFNQTRQDYPRHRTLHDLFSEQARKTPDAAAVVGNHNVLTYNELDQRANRLARFLMENQIPPEAVVALMMEAGTHMMIAIFGILKAGAAYCPISPDAPPARIKYMLEDTGASLLISSKKFIRRVNQLQWDVPTLQRVICPDSLDFYTEPEETAQLMSAELWDYVAREAFDDISAGGWKSSYTGAWLSREIMDQYGANIRTKLAPHITPDSRILEIGCASGISLAALAPLCGFYYATDLSAQIIHWTTQRVQRDGLDNIRLQCLPAHRIDELEEKEFDIIVINSVIQNFSGHNYLRDVLRKAVQCLGPQGKIFIGDVWDQDLKLDFIRSLEAYKQDHAQDGVRTKTDRSDELFVSRRCFEDMRRDIAGIAELEFTHIHASENEISGYGYDLLMYIDKERPIPINQLPPRHKYQYDSRALQPPAEVAPAERTHSGGLSYLIYTSGSTGSPKGVMVTHRSVVNLITGLQQVYQQHSGSLHVLLSASVTFDASVQQIFAALLQGHSLHPVDPRTKRDAAAFARFLHREAIDIADGTPALFALLADHCRRTGTPCGVRHFLIGGEAFPMQTARTFYTLPEHRNIPITNVYGPTECTVDTTAFTFDGNSPLQRIPIGKPLANTRVYIMDQRLRLVPLGVHGEICIAGDGLARGYWKAETRTAEKFMNLPTDQFPSINAPYERIYRSGDLGRLLEDGNLEFAGRNDDQVKIRGYRIELGEIQYHLLQHPLVDEAVVAVPHNQRPEDGPVAYIKGHPHLNLDMLRDHLRIHLDDYMIPAYFIPVDAFPLTPNGKVDRKKLPGPAQAALTGAGRSIAPRNEIEVKLLALWKALLNLPRISVTDNFFDIGGHSLSAVRLVSRIEEELGVSLPLSALFKASTIESLGQLLQSQAQALPWSPIVALQPVAPSGRPPLFCFHPVGGSVFCYRDLAHQLGPYQPFYVLQALGLEEGQEPLTCIEDMAAYYIKEIQKVQPRGPYLLAGWSFGGLTAYETARQLNQQGQSVAMIALIDTTTITSAVEKTMAQDDAAFLIEFFGSFLNVTLEQLRAQNPDQQIETVVACARESGFIDADFGVPHARRLLRVFKNNGQAILKYHIPPYSSNVHLFRAQTESPLAVTGSTSLTLGWENYAAGGVNAFRIPGDHATMLQAPQVDQLAQKMEQCINDALDNFYRSNQ